MNLITGNPWMPITAAAQQASYNARVAVAYFGSSGDTLLPLRRGSRLAVDASLPAVQAGITNPTALRRLHEQGVQVYTVPLLHAKAFAFDQVGFVGSTNASTRSAKHLVEAIVRVRDAATIQAIRTFVDSICQDRLTLADLRRLQQEYRPPRAPVPAFTSSGYKRLLMEIPSSDTQGYSGHQLQPPLPAWDAFFAVTRVMPTLPEFKLRNIDTGTVIARRVVRHTNVLTLDVPEGQADTLWEVWHVGFKRYDYRVITPNDPSFSELNQEVRTTPNPLRNHGRYWIIT